MTRAAQERGRGGNAHRDHGERDGDGRVDVRRPGQHERRKRRAQLRAGRLGAEPGRNGRKRERTGERREMAAKRRRAGGEAAARRRRAGSGVPAGTGRFVPFAILGPWHERRAHWRSRPRSPGAGRAHRFPRPPDRRGRRLCARLPPVG